MSRQTLVHRPSPSPVRPAPITIPPHSFQVPRPIKQELPVQPTQPVAKVSIKRKGKKRREVYVPESNHLTGYIRRLNKSINKPLTIAGDAVSTLDELLMDFLNRMMESAAHFKKTFEDRPRSTRRGKAKADRERLRRKMRLTLHDIRTGARDVGGQKFMKNVDLYFHHAKHEHTSQLVSEGEMTEDEAVECLSAVLPPA
jgi:hypothetical protein